MKINSLRSLWIASLSVFYTVNTTGLCVIKRFYKANTRTWVDVALHKWVNRVLKLIDLKCVVYNPHNVLPIPGQANILMCNHTSIYDIPISFKAFPHHSIRMLAKRELINMPIMGKGMEAAQFPFIDRKNRHQAVKDLAYARELMQSGILMWIAPEGTRTKNGKLAPFKKGAFVTAIEAKANIIPIAIKGAYDLLPAGTLNFKRHQTVEIHIGKPVDASTYSVKERDELVKIVYDSIKEMAEGKD